MGLLGESGLSAKHAAVDRTLIRLIGLRLYLWATRMSVKIKLTKYLKNIFELYIFWVMLPTPF